MKKVCFFVILLSLFVQNDLFAQYYNYYNPAYNPYFMPTVPQLSQQQLEQIEENVRLNYERNNMKLYFNCENNTNVENVWIQRIFMGMLSNKDNYCYDLVTIKFKDDTKFYKYRFYNDITSMSDIVSYGSLANGYTETGNAKLTYPDGSHCEINVSPNYDGDEFVLYNESNGKNKYLFKFDPEFTKYANGINTTPSYNNSYSNNNSNSNSNSSVTYNETCTFCGGKGWRPGFKTPTYGITKKYYCTECGEMVNPSHSHDQCSACRGRGYVTKIR